MKTLKVISGNLNNQYCEIPPTSESINGRISSLKKDGTFIEGRKPMPEEESLLWRFALTSKQKVNKNDNQLYAIIHVPEEGVDVIDDNNKKMHALGQHILNHQHCYYFKEVMEGGKMLKKQSNKNYRRNHLLSFEVIDESAIEEKRYQDSRLETKYRAIIDALYDESDSGEFLEICYGCGIVKPERNSKIHNYHLLINKLQINPVNFQMYYDDPDRIMVNTIRKAEKMENPATGEPYITSDQVGVSFFNGVAIGKNIDEMKIHFRQHEKEYEYLVKVTKIEVEVPKDISTKVVKTAMPQRESVSFPETEGADNKNSAKMRTLSINASTFCRSMKSARDKNKTERIEEIKQSIEEVRRKNPDLLDYFNKKLTEKSLEYGTSID